MPKATLREKDTFEKMMSRFRKSVERSGILNDVKSKEFYEKPTAKRRRLKNAAARRHHLKQMKNRDPRDY